LIGQKCESRRRTQRSYIPGLPFYLNKQLVGVSTTVDCHFTRQDRSPLRISCMRSSCSPGDGEKGQSPWLAFPSRTVRKGAIARGPVKQLNEAKRNGSHTTSASADRWLMRPSPRRAVNFGLVCASHLDRRPPGLVPCM
jgi:hypothetical protein